MCNGGVVLPPYNKLVLSSTVLEQMYKPLYFHYSHTFTAQCPELPAIVNGFITYAPDDVADYDIGTIATYQCNPGFILVGNMTRDCLEAADGTGEFNSEAPICECKELDKCLLYLASSTDKHCTFSITM